MSSVGIFRSTPTKPPTDRRSALPFYSLCTILHYLQNYRSEASYTLRGSLTRELSPKRASQSVKLCLNGTLGGRILQCFPRTDDLPSWYRTSVFLGSRLLAAPLARPLALLACGVWWHCCGSWWHQHRRSSSHLRLTSCAPPPRPCRTCRLRSPTTVPASRRRAACQKVCAPRVIGEAAPAQPSGTPAQRSACSPLPSPLHTLAMCRHAPLSEADQQPCPMD